jgi:hypothetical protein
MNALDAKIWAMIEARMKRLHLYLDGINICSTSPSWYACPYSPFVVSSNVSGDYLRDFTEVGRLYQEFVWNNSEEYVNFNMLYAVTEEAENFVTDPELKKKIQFVNRTAAGLSVLI